MREKKEKGGDLIMRLSCVGTNSEGNSYALISDDEILILDAGVPIKAMMPAIDFQISKVSGVLITHSHSDHDKYASEWMKRGIKVIRPFDETHKNTTIKKGSKFSIRPFELKDSLGNWVHSNGNGSPCEIYGYFITLPNNERLVYATDCEFIKWKFPDINHFLIEANYDLDTLESDGDIKNIHVFGGHHSIQAACKFIQANQTNSLKNVILCHLSNDNGSPEKFMEMMKATVNENVNVYIAKKGLEIEL